MILHWVGNPLDQVESSVSAVRITTPTLRAHRLTTIAWYTERLSFVDAGRLTAHRLISGSVYFLLGPQGINKITIKWGLTRFGLGASGVIGLNTQFARLIIKMNTHTLVFVDQEETGRP